MYTKASIQRIGDGKDNCYAYIRESNKGNGKHTKVIGKR